MATSTLATDTCRRFLIDHNTCVREDVMSKVLGALRSRNLKVLTSLTSLSDLVQHESEFLVLRQCEAFFKKNSQFVDEKVCAAAAEASFQKAEEICRVTNKRLEYYYLRPERLMTERRKQIVRAQDYISRVLSDTRDLIADLPRLIRLTSGATATRSMAESPAVFKLDLKPVCTAKALPYVIAMYNYRGFKKVRPKVMQTNRVQFVPKNWKTPRTIACEPDANVPFQLAIDAYIKSRLLKFGQDLCDQSTNQELARIGSIDGTLATVDLRMASDTLSLNTAAWLLPCEWFRLIADFRATHFSAPFGEGRYAKFSSMGNGATFALESLVFAALCHAVGSKRFSIFGDDIVIETELVEPLRALLSFFGFSFNEEKSFVAGPFRESCGSDWVNGRLVTPFYLRELPSTLGGWAHVINGLAKLAVPYGELAEMLAALVKEHKVPLVPFNERSTSGIWVTPSEAYRRKLITFKDRNGRMTYCPRFKGISPKSPTKPLYDYRAYQLWFLSTSKRVVEEQKDSLFLYGREKSVGPVPVESPLNVTSRVPLTSHKYVRRWVRWWIPSMATLPHLYWWEELLARE